MSAGRIASAWAVAGGAASRGLSFLFFLLIARELSPATVGVMAIGLAFSSFLDAFNELGLVEQMVRHPDERSSLTSTVFWLQIGAASISGLLLLLITPWLVQHYGESGLHLVTAGIALACVLNASSFVPKAILLRRQAFKNMAMLNIVAVIFGGGIGWWMAKSHYGVLSLVVMHVVNTLISSLAIWWLAQWLPRMAWDKNRMGEAWRLARHTLGTRMVDTFTSRADQLVIGSLFGSTVLGLYSLAMRFFDVLFFSISMQLSSVMLARLSLNTHDIKKTMAVYLHELRFISLIGPPVFLMNAIFLPPVLIWVIGEKWATATPFIQIILGTGVFLAISFSHSLLLTVMGHTKINLYISLASTLIWLIAAYFMPSFGAIFAALIWSARMLLGIPIQLLFLQKIMQLSIRHYLLAIKPAIASSTFIVLTASIMALLGWMSPQTNTAGFLLGTVACIAAATYTAWLFVGTKDTTPEQLRAGTP